jgi:two-component system, cell cycle response regulator
MSQARSKTVVTVISKISEKPSDREACLVVIYGIELGRKYNLEGNQIGIGRSSKADIQIDQESVSRNHARINGTGKNFALRDGDFIKIGRTIFKFLSGGNIENAYHEEIYRLTTVDGLTQIFNRRYFLEQLDREVSRCKRYRRNLSLILFDIDHFKNINDSYGHLAGDYVLKQLATVIRGKIRREDVLARYGGEEFVIVLPEIDVGGATAFAEKVRKLVEKAPFRFEDTRIAVTVSVGAATCKEGDDAPSLIKCADEKLYEAKNAGRNCVRS